MSNWNYAQVVPTQAWRSAMTLPRDLSLVHVGNEIYIASKPVEELNKLYVKKQAVTNFMFDKQINMSQLISQFQLPCKIDLALPEAKSFSLAFSNDNKETVIIGYDEKLNHYYINRAKTGEADFEKTFNIEHSAPRLTDSKRMHLTVIADVSSIELFADDGLSVMTAIYFPFKVFDQLQLLSREPLKIDSLSYTGFRSIWK
jgi:fructan beta-fructosidase